MLSVKGMRLEVNNARDRWIHSFTSPSVDEVGDDVTESNQNNIFMRSLDVVPCGMPDLCIEYGRVVFISSG